MLYDKFVDAEGNLAFQLKFLAKAVGYDETRYFMQYIHIEPSDKGGGLLGVATDGRHLHLVDPLGEAEAYGLTPGYWQALRAYKKRERIWIARLDDSCTKDWASPAWRKVFPAGEAAYKTAFAGFTFKRGDDYRLAQFIHDFPDVTAMNLAYLKSLGTRGEWDVEWRGLSNALKFTEGERTALIMPLRG